MEQTSSKKIMLWIFVVMIVVISLVGLSYAFFRYSRLSDTSTVIQTGGVDFQYVEETNGITLTNAVPTPDVDAINTTDENAYFDFYISYNFSDFSVIRYEIDIEDTTDTLESVVSGENTKLDSSRIKVALEDRTVTMPEEPMVVNPTYFQELELRKASNEQPGYKLYEKTGNGAGKDYYRLYMWIPEYDSNGEVVPVMDTDAVKGIGHQAFSVKINVQADDKVS